MSEIDVEIEANMTYETKLENYYGNLQLHIKEKKYFLYLKDYMGSQEIEVSEEFGEAFIKEYQSNQLLRDEENDKDTLE